ncbi:alpha/beta hydrolase [Hazenella coriacea]|uniref:AB hydrolase-1 domain-containing protein n=1 Tax=Hazenella coriacea TaxID=1179467 RepID=A0A4R3L220_9BACL|nr:alpha/beta hydrolase [Hazenella coriacea]TCS93489.1 hypothetical protein EDD58_107137 [Hazenella coriacea]
MKRVAFKNSRELTLIGHHYESSSSSIIIMCHGFTSNKTSKGRFDRFASTFHQLGYSVLVFDFSGCGESDTDQLTIAKQIDDLQAAIAFVKSREYHEIALYGHSLGSRVCLECYTPDIATMVLTGALTGSMKYDWNEYFTPEQMQELKEVGYLTTLGEGDRKVLIDQQMLLDFELVNQQELLTNVRCPVLVIHGNADEEEKSLYERTQKGLKWLPNDSRLEIIDGANHSFMDHLSVVERFSTNWFVKHFSL